MASEEAIALTLISVMAFIALGDPGFSSCYPTMVQPTIAKIRTLLIQRDCLNPRASLREAPS
jgi:hypothetical protein